MPNQGWQDVRSVLAGRSRKLSGARRTVSLEETLAHLGSMLAPHGITRVGEKSRLDRVEIPIAKVVRPNARGETITLCAGVTLEEARVAAIASAIESWHGEHPRIEVRLDRYSAMIGEGSVVDPSQLPRYEGTILGPRAGRGLVHRCRFDEAAIIPWAKGSDLFTGETVWVPYEIVHTDRSSPPIPTSGSFLTGRAGLASGNCLAEAVLQGLLECIECDAVARFRGDAPVVELGTIGDRVALLRDRIARAGLSATVRDLSTAIGVPVFRAELRSEDGRWIGYGSDPSLEGAIAGALTDAARAPSLPPDGPSDRTSARQELDRPAPHGETIEDDLRWVLERLRAGGVSRALVIDLSQDAAWPVVRVIVPGLRAADEEAW